MDADAGANELQNFPVLASASATTASVTVNGSLNTTANATCTLQFFYGSNRQGHQLTDAAPILLGLFIWREGRAPAPLIDLSLFLSAAFSAGCVGVVLS